MLVGFGAVSYPEMGTERAGTPPGSTLRRERRYLEQAACDMGVGCTPVKCTDLAKLSASASKSKSGMSDVDPGSHAVKTCIFGTQTRRAKDHHTQINRLNFQQSS